MKQEWNDFHSIYFLLTWNQITTVLQLQKIRCEIFSSQFSSQSFYYKLLREFFCAAPKIFLRITLPDYNRDFASLKNTKPLNATHTFILHFTNYTWPKHFIMIANYNGAPADGALSKNFIVIIFFPLISFLFSARTFPPCAYSPLRISAGAMLPIIPKHRKDFASLKNSNL